MSESKLDADRKRAAGVTEQNSAEKKGAAILFVCTANICRSPMAAALFRSQLRKVRTDWQDWQIDSAGTWGLDGEPAAKLSRLVMAERGLNITAHRARTVTGEMLEGYDLILTMEPGHKEALQIEFPAVANRVFMLSEMEGTVTPVKDPYGGPIEAYLETIQKLESMLENGMERIQTLALGEQS
jgi:protein-tyrosine phosphatase